MKPNRKHTSFFTLALMLFAFALWSPTAFADSSGTPPGQAAATTPAPTPAPAPAAETTPAPKARREDIEPKTLADAKSQLKQARDDRDQADKALADAKAETARISGLFDEAMATGLAAQTALADMTAARDLAVSNYNRATSQLTEANENIARLEKLMKLKGVAPSAAVPLVDETAQSSEEQRAALVKTLNEAKDPLAKGKAAEALRLFDLSQKA